MRPSTKPSEDEYKKLLEARFAPLDTEITELKKKLTETKLVAKAAEIKLAEASAIESEHNISVANAVNKMNAGTVPTVIQSKKTKIVNDSIDDGRDDHSHDEGVFCPNCDNGSHEHKINFSGSGKIVGKCTGDKCGDEFILVPKKPDFACSTCGLPVKKDIIEKNEIKSCPLCGNIRTLPFNLEEKIRMDTIRKTL